MEGSHVRVSDGDRAATLETLQRALADGRITLTEFDERSAAATTSVTRGELGSLTVDLAPPASTLEPITLGGTLCSVRRKGAWRVPQALTLRTRLGSIELDLTAADIPHDTVAVELDILGGSVELRLPEGASVTFTAVETSFGSTEDHRRSQGLGGRPHFEFRGRVVGGSVELRGPRRPLFR
ncbi:DUF1707 SHOCT-like domain-containing protein [Pseudonocardia pini]|uniref:DUF1707 SHOCT-like domain-containing protein n=1 Tax=Pseudonocardia pini TaxID=2758030 RepID=UPI0015F0A887|nr:DUF1707 domain-containing protein [Pseudonocardia pini]